MLFSVAGVLAAAPRSGVSGDRARATSVATMGNSRSKQAGGTQRNGAVRTRAVSVRTAVTPAGAREFSGAGPLTRARAIINDASSRIVSKAFDLSNRSTGRSAARSATNRTNARMATPGNMSRARATAVFSDISKLGTGYNSCRDAYNTCMDQFCAAANDTYRRCFCSNGFKNLRDKEDALDSATAMLAQFENNNLDAVNKTAEEVNAMYSATEGEIAIKKDTTAAASLLNDISDLLAGKKKATTPPPQQTMTSWNGLSVNFATDFSDIWGDDSSSSIFVDNTVQDNDLSALEGLDLYNSAHSQCMQLLGDSCEAGAVKNMVKSAYNILITQDCNAYQKKLDAKSEQVKSTVRTAEKYLREARLEEYRSHNSADVNECMDKVEKALTQSSACGSEYEKCMDHTGVYINSSTGEPIYSPSLFKLSGIIKLDGSADVLGRNPEFNKFLDSKRMYAKTALETCRDIADTVWNEFKRNALIKIAQAQDEKIEEVKMSCVSTMKECYDTQSGALKGFDENTAVTAGALAARAAHDMCADKVLACARLYGDTDGCTIDSKTNKITQESGKQCGFTSLMNFVNSVDNTRINEGCIVGIQSYLKQICTPTSGNEGYPWNCRLRDLGDIEHISWTRQDNPSSISGLVVKYAWDNCVGVKTNITELDNDIRIAVENELQNIKFELGHLIGEKCESGGGIWVDKDSDNSAISNGDILDTFYSTVYGKTHAQVASISDSWGKCVKNTIKANCEMENNRTGGNGYAVYDDASGVCRFSPEYYKYQCEIVRGIWDDDNRCYIRK